MCCSNRVIDGKYTPPLIPSITQHVHLHSYAGVVLILFIVTGLSVCADCFCQCPDDIKCANLACCYGKLTPANQERYQFSNLVSQLTRGRYLSDKIQSEYWAMCRISTQGELSLK